METITIDKDIRVLYVTATSFPEGIADALAQIHALVPEVPGRRFFGVSRPESAAVIIYRGAAEEMQEGEAERLHCDTLVLKAGKYFVLTVKDYVKDIQAIGRAFQTLLHRPDLDPLGYCVEWYYNDKDVHCMIRCRS